MQFEKCIVKCSEESEVLITIPNKNDLFKLVK